MSRRVAIVGQGLVTAFGETWEENRIKILECQNAVRHMQEWEIVQGLITKLAAPCDNFVAPEHYTRKKTRSMSRVSIMATRASELALINAGLLDDPFIKSGRVGVAYGSSFGSTYAVKDFATMLTENTTGDLTANSYVKMMPQTAAVNISLFFGITGRIIPTSTACTSGSMAIGYAYEAIKNGYQDAMVAGKDAGLSPSDIGYISAHGTGTARGDVAESNATANIYGNKTPISTLKSYFGHTLGACGAVEAIAAVNMMNEGWFNPNLNLHDVDPQCGDLDYIMDKPLKKEVEFIQSNNFAFGGINTSMVIKRVK